MHATYMMLAAAWTAFQIDPFYTKPHSRDCAPEDGRETTELVAHAAIGEIEAVSFMFRSDAAIAKLNLVPSDLKGPGGAVIPAAAVDVRTVKVWWQDKIRWDNYYNWEKYAKKNALLPDILLHDDSLIRVDEAGTNNYLRMDYPEGVRYVCVSEDTPDAFNDDLEPVRDAKTFIPFDVKAGEYRQYWLTLRVPEDAQPGAYAGRIALVGASGPVGELTLSLEVYPFALPTPRTRYDPSRDYRVWIMNHDTLEIHLRQAKNLKAAEEKVLNIYRNMAEHNCHPGGAGEIRADSPHDLGLRGLALLQQAGHTLRPLFAGSAHDGEWMSRRQEGTAPQTPEAQATELDAAKVRFRQRIDRDRKLYQKYAGHTDLIYTSIDECATAVNRLQFPFFDELHRQGLRVFATAAKSAEVGFEIDMNDILSTISAREACAWHLAGGKAYTYAAQFFGAIQPDHYRRDKGLRFWSVGYDGANEYVFYEGVRWNDFIANNDNYGTFGIVFPVQDGILDTCAWEAYREGVDDIRYFSLLNLRATAAMKSGDKALAERGRAELAWLLSVDSERNVDLNALRREVAARILTLPPCTGERRTPFVSPKIELAPPTKPPAVADGEALAACDKWLAKDRADVALAYARQAMGRTDLEQDAYDKAVLKTVEACLALRDRAGALKLLEAAQERAPVTAAHRAKMQLEQAGVLIRKLNYAERIPEASVDRAAKLLETAGRVPGLAGRRNELFVRLLEAYRGLGRYDRVLALTESVVKAGGTAGSLDLRSILDMRVRAAGRLGQYEKCVREFKNYEKLGKGGNRKDLLLFVAELAAKQNDAELALRCYTDIYAYFDPKDDGCKYERGRIERAMNHWKEKARKTQKSDLSADEDDISLDE